MPLVDRITSLKLDQLALDYRERGESAEVSLKAINGALPAGEKPISRSTLLRFYARSPRVLPAAIHQPARAEQHALRAISVTEKVIEHMDRCEALMAEAEAERNNAGKRNWNAITGMLRETRATHEFYADILEKVYNAEQIRMFQQEVMDAIASADPDTAKRITAALKERQSIRRAALLGASDV